MANVKIQGTAGQGGANVITAGIASTTESLATYPLCTVTVYNAGTLDLATLWTDSAGTVPKANPFTSGTDASWFFYGAIGSSFDIRFSGTGIDTPFTVGDVPAVGASGGGSGVSSVFGRVGIVTAANNDYTWAKIDKTVSSIADITTRDAGDLSSGTLPDARFPAVLPAISGANLTNLSLANTVGILPVTRGGTGTSTQFTAGSVVFAGASGVYGQDNAQFFWDDTNNRLGLGTVTPGQKLEVSGGDIFVNNATANLYLKDTSTGLQAASTTVITPLNNNALRSTTFTSGLVGWNISAAGNAEFDNVDVRGAIHASIFTYNAINATAGTLGVFKSAAKLRTDATVPAGPTYGTTTMTVDVVDAEGLAHGSSQLFVVNDILRLKDGLVGDTWLKVTAASDQTTFWRYTCAIMAGTANVTYRAGMGVPDYGQTGQGFIILTSDQTNAPYEQMATHTASFSSLDAAGTLTLTPQMRVGNLNGSYGFSGNTYGLGAGTYGVAGKSWIIAEPSIGVRLGNNTTTRIQLAPDGSGFLASSNIVWDTSGNATIAGWVVNATSITKNEVKVAAGVDISDVAGTGEAWFGKSAAGYYGMFLKGTTAAKLSIAAGNSLIGSAGRPYMGINDGTRWRVMMGELNTTAWDGAATNSMGMKIWDSSGNILAHFSDVANTIAGWTITTTKFSGTGVDLVSGANAYLAFGSTPPTSSSTGTGIFLDRTGLYGLLANVLQVKVDATTGGIVAAAGDFVVDSNGLTLYGDDTVKPRAEVKFKETGGGTVGSAKISYRNIGVGSAQQLLAQANSTSASSFAQAYLEAKGEAVSSAAVDCRSYGSSHASQASKGYVQIAAANGVIINHTTVTANPAASVVLELSSTVGAFLPPRMTGTQRDALTATNGMVLYNSTTDKLQVRAAGAWVDLH
jgi:hypothetical protein